MFFFCFNYQLSWVVWKSVDTKHKKYQGALRGNCPSSHGYEKYISYQINLHILIWRYPPAKEHSRPEYHGISMSTVKCRSCPSGKVQGLPVSQLLYVFFVESAQLRLPQTKAFLFHQFRQFGILKMCCYVTTKMSQSQKEMFRIPFQAKKHPKSMFSFGRVLKKVRCICLISTAYHTP